MHRPIRGFILALLASAAFACGKKETSEAAPASTTSTSSLASPVPTDTAAVKFAVDPKSKTAIDMPAPKEHIQADTSAALGTLDINARNLASTHGEVRVDLSTLQTHTFGDHDKDAQQTEHALTWLEVGPKSPASQQEANRWAVYTIRSVDALSATELAKVNAEKVGADDVRTVTATAHGDFLLHGHKVAKDATLEAKFRYPSGAPADSKPASVEIRSKAPLHIVLAEHDVKPRDNFGKLAQGAFGLLGTKVAETADITLDLRARPGQ